MKFQFCQRLLLLAVLLVTQGLRAQTSFKEIPPTGFDYEGRLLFKGVPANGPYLFRFSLHNTETRDTPAPLTPIDRGNWSETGEYLRGDVVLENEISWLAFRTNTAAPPHSSATSPWLRLGGGQSFRFAFQGAWERTTQYQVGSVVTHLGLLWIRISPLANNLQPNEGSSWLNIPDATQVGGYTEANVTVFDGVFTAPLSGFDAKALAGPARWLNVEVRQTNSETKLLEYVSLNPRQTIPLVPYAAFAFNGIEQVRWRGPYQPGTFYEIGDAVSVGANSYICQSPHQATGRFNSAYWTATSESRARTAEVVPYALYALNSGGATGPAGPAGPVGPVGPAGPTGPVGPQGPKGDTGSTGPQGLVGLTGPAGPQGVQGLPGATGAKGEKGDKGDAGVAGPAGPAGPQGPKGDTGGTGPQGLVGLTGPAGPQGVQGLPGATGAKGEKGDKGDAGVAGPAGPAGPQGPKGDTGSTGPQGLIGLTGPAGPQGVQGLPGATGAKGEKGDKGDAGVAGPAGPAGPQGPKGDTGGTGPQGLTGLTGPAGPQGLQGLPGAAGAKGDKGDKGDTGVAGPAGPAGPQGLKGDTGSTGPQGLTGLTGATGPKGDKGDTGATGPAGATGPQGPQGPAGPVGPQGLPGSSDGWSRLGNAGTTSVNFLGTTDDQPLNFRVNNLRAFRLQYGHEGTDFSGVNVVGGDAGNYVAPTVNGATVFGGGIGYVFGGDDSEYRTNRVTARMGTISGGSGNTVSAIEATVSGGQGNTASGEHAVIGGGYQNRAEGRYSMIPGGVGNQAGENSFAAGWFASALHPGSFVWSDTSPDGAQSTQANEFSVKASGGARFLLRGARLTVEGSVFASQFVGGGAGLTGVKAETATNALNFTGSIVDSQLSANIPRLNAANAFVGNQNVSGNVGIGAAPDNAFRLLVNGTAKATQFVGGGAGLTGINFTGSVADTQLSANIPRLNAANAFVGNQAIDGHVAVTKDLSVVGNEVVSGNVGLGATPDNAFRLLVNGTAKATQFVGGGAGLTGINFTGSVADTQLSANVPRLNAANEFSAGQTIRTASGGLDIRSSNGGQFGSGTLRVQGATGLGADPNPNYRLHVQGAVLATGGFVGSGAQLTGVNALTAETANSATTAATAATAIHADTATTAQMAITAQTFTGPVADSQLSANVPLRNAANTYTASQIITGGSGFFGNHSGALAGVGAGVRIFRDTVSGTGNLFAYDYTGNVPLHLVLQQPGGRVGIGTTSPSTVLHVATAGDTEISLQSTGNNRRWTLQASGGTDGVGLGGTFQVIDRTAAAARMVFDTVGNVGIGTAPSTKLHVNGMVRASALDIANDAFVGGILQVDSSSVFDGRVEIADAGPEPLTVYDQYTNPILQVFDNLPADRGIRVTGSAYRTDGGVFWGIFSDERLKQNIRPYEHGLDAILKLRTQRFEYRDDPVHHTTSGHEEVGVIAQQVRSAIPEAVIEGTDGYLSLDAGPIYWAAINAIQELNARVETQQAGNAELAARLEERDAELNQLREQNRSLEERLAALERLLLPRNNNASRGGAQ